MSLPEREAAVRAAGRTGRGGQVMGGGSGIRPARRRLAGRIGRFVPAGAALLLVGFLITCWSIGSGVQAISRVALREHPGDRVPALMAFVASDQHAARDRNRAVWALGQLGDPRALPLLQRLHDGRESDHGLSRYELKKAVALCRGEFNLGACVWRHGAWGARRLPA